MAVNLSTWYSDWQNGQHARTYDHRARLNPRQLRKNYEKFNDVRLLNERLGPQREATLLEIGCATGEFYRFLQVCHPRIHYVGVDVSEPAVARAKEKYPQGRFFRCDPFLSAAEIRQAVGLSRQSEWVYSKDVLHHQTEPDQFLKRLLDLAAENVILRTRTRDVGATVLDPELSCQHHYQGWMPYLVFNLEELIQSIQKLRPEAELIIYRHHMVLGGKEGRFLPKECYLPQTGTAETAIGIFLNSPNRGQVRLEDRKDMDLEKV